MANKSWKQAERRVAKFFGCLRTILSGSFANHRDNTTNADTDHPTLFLEIRQRRSHGVWSWYRETKPKAVKEHKIPVIVLDEVHAKGAIVCIHTDDLKAFCVEFLRNGKGDPVRPTRPLKQKRP